MSLVSDFQMTTTSPKPFTLAERDNGEMTNAEVQDLFIFNLCLYFILLLDLYLILYLSIRNDQYDTYPCLTRVKEFILRVIYLLLATIIVLTIFQGEAFESAGFQPSSVTYNSELLPA